MSDRPIYTINLNSKPFSPPTPLRLAAVSSNNQTTELGAVSEADADSVTFTPSKFDDVQVPNDVEFGSQLQSNALFSEAHALTIRATDAEKYADLRGPHGGFEIVDTARRAISQEQLEKVDAHVQCRFAEGERWKVWSPDGDVILDKADQVNLYHMNDWVIKPATIKSEEELENGWSLVEFMASSAQDPDFFVSHWWGNPVHDFVKCCRQHCMDRMLSKWLARSPNYWVCAYANRQHKNEICLELPAGQPLTETPFFRAMKLAKGTVSVLDRNGTAWTRIWCVYELHESLVGANCSKDQKYTYDMYVASEKHEIMLPGYYTFKCQAVFDSWWSRDISRSWRFRWGVMTLDVATFLPFVLCFGSERVAHSWGSFMGYLINNEMNPFGVQYKIREAAGITDGLVATDRGVSSDKIEREQDFPFDLLLRGATFHSKDGQASVQSDKERILDSIGAKTKLLDDTVHGVVADGSALRRAFEQGGPKLDHFLSAVRQGGLAEVELNLVNSPADTAENIETALRLIDPRTCTKLILSTRALREFPEKLVTNLYKLTELNLNNCSNLKSLPPEIKQLRQLTVLNLTGCLRLAHLPEEIAELRKLRHLHRKGCYSLTRLPDCSLIAKQNMLEIHFDTNDEFMLRVFLATLFPFFWVFEVWLIGGFRGCGWQLSTQAAEYFCWVVIVHEIVIWVLLQDVKSVNSQVCWAANGFRSFPCHWRNLVVVGHRLLFQLTMLGCGIYFSRKHDEIEGTGAGCSEEFSPASLVWVIIGLTLFVSFLLPNVLVSWAFGLDIPLILKHITWLVPTYSLVVFPFAWSLSN